MIRPETPYEIALMANIAANARALMLGLAVVSVLMGMHKAVPSMALLTLGLAIIGDATSALGIHQVAHALCWAVGVVTIILFTVNLW